jgi:hypothetical protein
VLRGSVLGGGEDTQGRSALGQRRAPTSPVAIDQQRPHRMPGPDHPAGRGHGQPVPGACRRDCPLTSRRTWVARWAASTPHSPADIKAQAAPTAACVIHAPARYAPPG